MECRQVISHMTSRKNIYAKQKSVNVMFSVYIARMMFRFDTR